MFKRYKIRKAKQFNDLKVTTKSLKLNSEYIEKTQIQKIKLLLKNSNKSNAYKRILQLSQEEFDRYLYFIAINVMSEYLETDDSVLVGCIKRILKSRKFKCIHNVFAGYMDIIKDDKFIDLVSKCQKRFYNTYSKSVIVDNGTYNYDDAIVLCHNKLQ